MSSTQISRSPIVLAEDVWREAGRRHAERVDGLIGDYLRARRSGAKHPVIDFLFTYYASRPAHVRRWHPGHGVELECSARTADTFLEHRGYVRTRLGVRVDPQQPARVLTRLRAADTLLRATASRPPRFGCFGLHEWAMLYRTDAIRHEMPLRLGSEGTDRVVESMPLRCTHFDAFRFFTPEARPRNEAELSRDTQSATEQPGCLHATMDLYRVCFTLAPLIESELTFDAFALALTAREIDMRASPYDLTELGYTPIEVETPAGRAEYVRGQSAVAAEGAVLRTRLLTRCAELLAVADHTPETGPDLGH